ncbi:MAG: hypothetical protein LBQ59_01085 [Candidatus Peribacteria bacterium]|jgi:hypothetical protein|nr:hypothetical protein [Candidatus Peribacteria bacterium]
MLETTYTCNNGNFIKNEETISSVICNTNYTAQADKTCKANTKTFTCAEKPTTGTARNSVSSYTQTWDGTAWTPADTTTTYNVTASNTACHYTCAANYTAQPDKTCQLTTAPSCASR